MLGVSQHMDLKLFGSEIIFEEFKPIWTRYLNVTDGRTDDMQFHNRALRYALASRGNQPILLLVGLYRYAIDFNLPEPEWLQKEITNQN